jgi:hypothetical protein
MGLLSYFTCACNEADGCLGIAGTHIALHKHEAECPADTSLPSTFGYM